MASDPVWLRRVGDGWHILLHVQPGARRSEVVGLHGDRLKIRLAAPPVDGRANEELVRFLARRLGVARSDVRVVRGGKSRAKTVAVPGAARPASLVGS